MRYRIVSIIKLFSVTLIFAIVTTACGGYGSNRGDDSNSKQPYPPTDENIKVVEIPIIKEGDI